MSVESIFYELEQYGVANDSQTTQRIKKMLNITRNTGEFLAVITKATQAKNIIEVGTSNGYSTLWFANALPEDGKIITLES